MSQTEARTSTGPNPNVDYDVLIIGAGFSGVRCLHEVRKLGLTARVLEAGTNVGGTWYWNRYPGARTDSEAWVYSFDFDKDLMQDWNWSERFPRQPEVERYVQHVVERFDMAKDIQFESRVSACEWDDDAKTWTVTTEKGDSFTSTFLVSASGLLHVTNKLPFPGRENFKGESYETSKWPKEKVEFAGKRVAVIGAGATAVQAIPVIAHTAEHLTVFQRTPNYVMPSRNRLIDDDERDAMKAKYDEIWAQAYQQVFGFNMDPANRVVGDMKSPEEHQQVLEAGWEAGGFRYLFETFDDLLVDQHSNDVASEFVRNKIRAIVKDPETAELLCPKEHPFGGKRPPLGHWYYETYNRDNVSLVSIKGNPVKEITETGVLLEDGSHYEVDLIVLSLGFDAVTGAMTAMDIRGKGGQTISEAWAEGPNSNYLGFTHEGFPNLFTMIGPGGPFANIPAAINKQGEFLHNTLKHALDNNLVALEPKHEAVEGWVSHCEELMGMTLLKEGAVQGNAWFIGANIPGKKHAVLFYFGGCGAYFEHLQNEIDSGYANFEKTPVAETAST